MTHFAHSSHIQLLGGFADLVCNKRKRNTGTHFFYGSCILKHHKTAAEATTPECLLGFRICVLDFLPAPSSLHCKNVISSLSLRVDLQAAEFS